MQKVKITQKDFDSMYEIEEIPEETPKTPEPKKEDTTPDLLSEEEQLFDDDLFEEMKLDD